MKKCPLISISYLVGASHTFDLNQMYSHKQKFLKQNNLTIVKFVPDFFLQKLESQVLRNQVQIRFKLMPHKHKIQKCRKTQ